MLFNSNSFIFIFLPIILFGFFWIGRRSHQWAAAWLVMASLFFYGWWNPKFVALLIVSILFNYTLGLSIRNHQKFARLLLVLGTVFNLSVLAFFKYANFFITSVNHLSSHPLLTEVDIILPLGISFFTFTQIAFLVDVYRDVAYEYNFIHYSLFVTYFPHLIAGPILHHKQMVPQFTAPETYQLKLEHLAVGFSIFTIGLTKKVIFADGFNAFATPVFDGVKDGLHPRFIVAWTGALAYSLQLYFDFSGYSDMAIGISRMFGIKLPINFYSPYKAHNIIEFWKRWHISLSQFLKEYLYIPLGGNRYGHFRRYCNLMTTMVLGGLWHGANWTFVVWGALHGAYLIINHAWQWLLKRLAFSESNRLLRTIGTLTTFFAVVIAWIFFRSDSFKSADLILRGIFARRGTRLNELNFWNDTFSTGLWSLLSDVEITIDQIKQGAFIGPLIIGLATIWLLPNSIQLFEKFGANLSHAHPSSSKIQWTPTFMWSFLLMFLLLLCFIKKFGTLTPSPFLYFQF